MIDVSTVSRRRFTLRRPVGLPTLFLLLTVATVQADPIGGGSVQTWKDGLTAAATLTIDDNTKPDHAWWTATGNAYDLQFTWFVITGLVTDNPASYHGTWQDFADLHAAGHDIQSHSVDHLASGSTLTIEQNYAQAITDIESNIPGSDVLTLAYPNGLNPGNGNDKTVAGQHYIAARGVVGTPNKLTGIDYLNVNSVSTSDAGFQYPGHDVGAPWADVSQLITPGNQYYEGLFSVHSHGLNAAKKDSITGLLDYMMGQEGGFWIAPFTKVTQYAQERDAANLVTQVISPEEIQYTLTDTLDNTRFYEPLTVKVRVDNTWNQVVATQGGQSLPVTLVLDGGEQFALVNSVPDAGVVSLTVPQVTGDYNASGLVEQGDLDLVLLNWGATWPPAITGWVNQQPTDDGVVNQNDLDGVLLNWGNSSVVSAALVPEPATGVMGGLLLGAALLSREWRLWSGQK